MVKPCAQCRRDFNGTQHNTLCLNCRRLNDAYPIPPGARRWCGGPAIPQNLPRYTKSEPGYMPTVYGGKLMENMVQTIIAAEMEAAVMGFEPAGDGALSDTLVPSGGDFGGGGASGSW